MEWMAILQGVTNSNYPPLEYRGTNAWSRNTSVHFMFPPPLKCRGTKATRYARQDHDQFPPPLSYRGTNASGLSFSASTRFPPPLSHRGTNAAFTQTHDPIQQDCCMESKFSVHASYKRGQRRRFFGRRSLFPFNSPYHDGTSITV